MKLYTASKPACCITGIENSWPGWLSTQTNTGRNCNQQSVLYDIDESPSRFLSLGSVRRAPEVDHLLAANSAGRRRA